jgi:hypothetical protein
MKNGAAFWRSRFLHRFNNPALVKGEKRDYTEENFCFEEIME